MKAGINLNNIITFILYFIFTCSGMVLIKFGGQESFKTIFTLPILKMSFSLLTFLGFIFYGISFLLYSSLISKYELSFLNPATVGITAILILACSVVIFNESITMAKIIGLTLILSGVFIINIFK